MTQKNNDQLILDFPMCKGFFVNHSIVGSLLIFCHMVYISGVNWRKTAEEVNFLYNKYIMDNG